MSEHDFVCDLEPRGDGGWDVWISEKPYRGVSTDAVLGKIGERKRIGGGWTSRWFVVSTRFERRARSSAAASIRQAHSLASEGDAEDQRWRENRSREALHVTSADVVIRPAGGESDG